MANNPPTTHNNIRAVRFISPSRDDPHGPYPNKVQKNILRDTYSDIYAKAK
jgi:hypothetical protein